MKKVLFATGLILASATLAYSGTSIRWLPNPQFPEVNQENILTDENGVITKTLGPVMKGYVNGIERDVDQIYPGIDGGYTITFKPLPLENGSILPAVNIKINVP